MRRNLAPALLSFLPSAASFIGHCNDANKTIEPCISCGCQNNLRHTHQTSSSIRLKLNAKRKSKKKSSTSKRNKRNNEKNISKDDDVVLSTAAQRPPATLAGIVEDHRYEQFFYDDATAQQLYQIVDLYEQPLLLCNPTLAVMAEKKGKPYKLLDRDTRFNFLSGYEMFSLTEPHLITNYDFDAIFIDPPFANVTPEEVAQCLRLMGANNAKNKDDNEDGDGIPLWVAYNSKREEKLLDALNGNGLENCIDLEPKWRLSYKEGVSLDMQDSIWLYGPKS